jgi:hypothetical protein
VLADLVMGQRSPDLDGGYFRRAADSTVYLVRGPLAELLGQAPDEWRDRRMASVPADSVVEVEVHRGRSSYRLAREAGGWRFGRGGALADSAAVRSLLGAYARLDADGFASEAQSDSARWDRPERRVRLFRADGSPLITLLADSAAGGFWTRVDSGEVVYRLESWTVDRLAPPDTTLRATPG